MQHKQHYRYPGDHHQKLFVYICMSAAHSSSGYYIFESMQCLFEEIHGALDTLCAGAQGNLALMDLENASPIRRGFNSCKEGGLGSEGLHGGLNL